MYILHVVLLCGLSSIIKLNVNVLVYIGRVVAKVYCILAIMDDDKTEGNITYSVSTDQESGHI